MRIAGLVLRTGQDRLRHDSQVMAGALRILCLGESTTAPMRDMLGDYSWPAQLEHLLRLSHPDLRIQVINKGITSANSSFIAALLPDWLERNEPHIVISMLGANDVSQWYGIVRFDSGVRGAVFRMLAHCKTFKLLQYLYYEGYPHQLQKSARTPPQSAYAALDSCQSLSRHVPLRAIEAEAACQRAAEERPQDPRPQAALGQLYLRLGRIADTGRAMQTAADLGSTDFSLYSNLASIFGCGTMDDLARAEKHALHAIEMVDGGSSSDVDTVYYKLFLIYSLERRFDKADALFKKILAQDPECQHRPLTLALAPDASVTAANYLMIRKLANARGIPLIAMQYARADIAELQRTLGRRKGTVLLSNKEAFDHALQDCRYEDLFMDRFGKTWGHCTRKGNGLIAANAAQAVESWLRSPEGRAALGREVGHQVASLKR